MTALRKLCLGCGARRAGLSEDINPRLFGVRGRPTFVGRAAPRILRVVSGSAVQSSTHEPDSGGNAGEDCRVDTGVRIGVAGVVVHVVWTLNIAVMPPGAN
jgi:hypothetical protein